MFTIRVFREGGSMNVSTIDDFEMEVVPSVGDWISTGTAGHSSVIQITSRVFVVPKVNGKQMIALGVDEQVSRDPMPMAVS